MQKEKSSCAVGTRIYSQNRNQRWYTEEESCCFKCIKMWTFGRLVFAGLIVKIFLLRNILMLH